MVSTGDRTRCDAGPTADFHDHLCPHWCAWGHPDDFTRVPDREGHATTIVTPDTHYLSPAGTLPHTLLALTGGTSATIDATRVTCPTCLDHLRSKQ